MAGRDSSGRVPGGRLLLRWRLFVDDAGHRRQVVDDLLSDEKSYIERPHPDREHRRQVGAALRSPWIGHLRRRQPDRDNDGQDVEVGLASLDMTFLITQKVVDN